jgi:hypothetical protein
LPFLDGGVYASGVFRELYKGVVFEENSKNTLEYWVLSPEGSPTQATELQICGKNYSRRTGYYRFQNLKNRDSKKFLKSLAIFKL